MFHNYMLVFVFDISPSVFVCVPAPRPTHQSHDEVERCVALCEFEGDSPLDLFSRVVNYLRVFQLQSHRCWGIHVQLP